MLMITVNYVLKSVDNFKIYELEVLQYLATGVVAGHGTLTTRHTRCTARAYLPSGVATLRLEAADQLPNCPIPIIHLLPLGRLLLFKYSKNATI